MSIPQGSTVFNTTYFTSLTNRINSASSCSELQAIVTNEFASIQGVKTAINLQVAALQPILALLSPPGANLSALATWIQNFITGFLTPYVKPYTDMATQLTQLATQITALTTAIQSAQARFTGCSVTIPPIT